MKTGWLIIGEKIDFLIQSVLDLKIIHIKDYQGPFQEKVS
jgi:hypothetical protein